MFTSQIYESIKESIESEVMKKKCPECGYVKYFNSHRRSKVDGRKLYRRMCNDCWNARRRVIHRQKRLDIELEASSYIDGAAYSNEPSQCTRCEHLLECQRRIGQNRPIVCQEDPELVPHSSYAWPLDEKLTHLKGVTP